MYPNENELNQEMSFEELRANSRGWLTRDWAAESKQRIDKELQASMDNEFPLEVKVENVEMFHEQHSRTDIHDSPNALLDNTIAVNIGGGNKVGRSRKMKIKEVKGETQTSAY